MPVTRRHVIDRHHLEASLRPSTDRNGRREVRRSLAGSCRGSIQQLHDLARWCLVLADERAPDGTRVHLEPGTEPLATTSVPVLVSREGHLAI